MWKRHISSNAKTRIAKLLRNVVGLLTCHEVKGNYAVKTSQNVGDCEASSCIKQFLKTAASKHFFWPIKPPHVTYKIVDCCTFSLPVICSGEYSVGADLKVFQ